MACAGLGRPYRMGHSGNFVVVGGSGGFVAGVVPFLPAVILMINLIILRPRVVSKFSAVAPISPVPVMGRPRRDGDAIFESTSNLTVMSLPRIWRDTSGARYLRDGVRSCS